MASLGHAQQMSSLDRERAEWILQDVAGDVHKHYYDPKFHGTNWDETVREAKAKIEKAPSFNMAMTIIAAALGMLNDSHTFFLPPQHAYRHDYGWQYQMIGDWCYVIRVRPHSDAEAKGVRPGDEVLSIDGFTPNRASLWSLQYGLNILQPQASLRLKLKTAPSAPRDVDVAAKIQEGKRVMDLTDQTGTGDIWNLVRQDESQDRLAHPRHFEKEKTWL